MDTVIGRSSVKEENQQRDIESNGNINNEGFKQDFSLKVQGTDLEKLSTEPDSIASSSRRKEQNNDQLESTKAEMGEVREENERLKIYLGKIMKDYQTLQTQFDHIVQQEASKKKSNITVDHHRDRDSTTEETELVSLSLGSFLGSTTKTNNNNKNKDEKNKINGKETVTAIKINHDEEGLSLGLDYKYISEPSNKSGATDQGGPTVSNPSAESSFEEQKVEETSWPPSKVLRPVKRNINSSEQQDEVSQVQNPVKKARVCVRARCDTPTMNDGCQWRKYGQKIAKGNPCPRAYYRCTVAPSCPVRKQVQRCADDMSILITTYEGTHNHPLPVSATAMASTTSAAASMLLSGSSTSSTASGRPADGMANAFNTFDSSKWNTNNTNTTNNNKQFYLPNTSTYSSFQSSHPTITLDLTNSSQINSSPFHNKFSSSSSSSSPVPNSYHGLYPSSSLNFGASPDNSNANNMSWANYSASTHQPPYHHLKSNNNIMGTLGISRQISTPFSSNPSTNTYQNYMHHNISTNPSSSSTTTTQVPEITIAAATKAITTDPTFQSALAAALTSIIGGGGGQGNNILQGEVLQNSKWITSPGDHQQQVHFSASAGATNNALSKGNVSGCASTFLNKTTSVGPTANSQQAVAGGLMFLSPNSMSFSSSKSASASPGDTREHTS